MSGTLHEDLSMFCCKWQKFTIQALLCITEYFYIVDGNM